MKRLAVLTLAFCAARVPLPAQVTVPQLGYARYPDGKLHQVRGIGANVIVDYHSSAPADAASFSDAGGLISSNGVISLLATNGSVVAEFQSQEPSPILHMDSPATSAVAWLPSQHVLLGWDGAKFTQTTVDDAAFAGPVTSVSLTSPTSAQFFVARPDSSVASISVSLPSGALTNSSTQPSARYWAYALQGWTISQNDLGLIAADSHGNSQNFPLGQTALLPSELLVEQMSTHWLHVISRHTGENWVLYVDSSKVNLFHLPPPRPEVYR